MAAGSLVVNPKTGTYEVQSWGRGRWNGKRDRNGDETAVEFQKGVRMAGTKVAVDALLETAIAFEAAGNTRGAERLLSIALRNEEILRENSVPPAIA